MTISLSVFWYYRFLIFSGEETVNGLFEAESALSLPPATLEYRHSTYIIRNK